MNKVIIDGINVFDCNNYITKTFIDQSLYEGECKTYKAFCKGIKNCMYKRLKRFILENFKLKKEYNEIYDYLQKREKLINEHIKETYQLDKYKKAIEEIRQIVEFAIEETLTLGQKNATDKILQIISEVQNER